MMMFRTWAPKLGAVILMGLSLAAQAAGFDHSSWDALLKKHVQVQRQGQVSQVNYAGLQQDRAQLQAYLQASAEVSRSRFEGWSKNEQLAFLINVYNAATVELVLTAYPKLDSIKDLGSLFQSPWKKKWLPLLGATRTLDDIEQGLIRGEAGYQEPRIHFALNCASIGCPALRAEAYRGDMLSVQLEDATRLFLSDRSRNRAEGTQLKISSIFKWYRRDFEQGWGGSQSLPQFLGRYAGALGLNDSQKQALQAGQMELDFLSYDWRLNRTP